MTASAHVLYLLHAEVPVGRVRHYLGITRADRLPQRLNEHAQRRGSRLTAELARRNRRLLLAQLWQAATPELERRMKARGHYDQHCPVCRHKTPDAALGTVPCPDFTDVHRSPLLIALGRLVDE